MADKFHINSSGDVRPCNATVKPCRFGEEVHFTDRAEAREVAESKLAKEYKSSSKPLKKRKLQRVKKRPVIPGVPAVMTERELDKEKSGISYSLHDWTVSELLKARQIDLQEIQKAEASSEYSVSAKVPSFNEVLISTDLARRELNLPPREKTGIDDSAKRAAQIEFDEISALETETVYNDFDDMKNVQDKIYAAREKLRKATEDEEA